MKQPHAALPPEILLQSRVENLFHDLDAHAGLHHLSEFARRILRRHVIDTDPLTEDQVAAEVCRGH
jgi:hypothetical protein